MNLQLEISPQHHDIVKGRNCNHILSIMEQTKTKVGFHSSLIVVYDKILQGAHENVSNLFSSFVYLIWLVKSFRWFLSVVLLFNRLQIHDLHPIIQNIKTQNKTLFQIIFPDLNDVNIKPIKKSQVTITGSIDGVYNARQQLIVRMNVSSGFFFFICFVFCCCCCFLFALFIFGKSHLKWKNR